MTGVGVAWQKLFDPHPSRFGRVVGTNPAGVADGFGERPIRNSFTVGETASRENGGTADDRPNELRRQAGLSDARLTDHGYKPSTSHRNACVELVLQRLELRISADKLCVQALCERARPGDHRAQTVGANVM